MALAAVDSNAQTVYSGDFEAESYFTTFEGSWKIIKSENGYTVKLGKNFKAKKAPDLKIYLSKLNFEDIDKHNASSKTSIFIAELKTYSGEVEYTFPAGVTPADFKSIVVHCVKYTKLWGGSSLN